MSVYFLSLWPTRNIVNFSNDYAYNHYCEPEIWFVSRELEKKNIC